MSNGTKEQEIPPRRERLWGLIGGGVGALTGGGSAFIARYVQGEAWRDMSGAPFPPSFYAKRFMPLDYWFFFTLLLGCAFAAAAVYFTRFGRYPRADGFGAALAGTICSLLGGTLLFARLWVVLR